MSNKSQRPKGYSDRTPEAIKNEYNQLAFQAGLEIANEERSIRNRHALTERMAKLEKEFNYASEQAQMKAKLENEAAVKATEAARAKAQDQKAASSEVAQASESTEASG